MNGRPSFLQELLLVVVAVIVVLAAISKSDKNQERDRQVPLTKLPVYVQMRVDRGTVTLTVEGELGDMLLLQKRLDEVQALLLKEDSLKGCEVCGNVTRYGPSTAVRVIQVQRLQGNRKGKETPVSRHLYEVRLN